MPAPEYTMSEVVSIGVVGLTVAVGVGVSTGVSSLIQPANITAVAIATMAIIPKIFFLFILFSPSICDIKLFGIKRFMVFFHAGFTATFLSRKNIIL
jgi:hypothetical protein